MDREWTEDEIRRAFDANAAAFSTLADAMHGETLQVDGLLLAATGSTLSFFNQAVATTHLAYPEHAIKIATSFFDDRNLPFVVSLLGEDRDAVQAVERAGLTLDNKMPLMLIDANELRTNQPAPPGLEIRRVDSRNLDEHIGGEFGAKGRDAYRTLLTSVLGVDGWEMFGGYIDGRGVSNGMSFTFDGLIGVYSVGTATEARRQGIGEATTATVIRAGFEGAATISYLFSSEMGYGVYERMGFRAVSSHRYYRRPADQ